MKIRFLIPFSMIGLLFSLNLFANPEEFYPLQVFYSTGEYWFTKTYYGIKNSKGEERFFHEYGAQMVEIRWPNGSTTQNIVTIRQKEKGQTYDRDAGMELGGGIVYKPYTTIIADGASIQNFPLKKLIGSGAKIRFSPLPPKPQK